jgi:site-specific DNA-cytosine methylase
MADIEKSAIKRFKERGYDEVRLRDNIPSMFPGDVNSEKTYVLKRRNRAFMVSVDHSKNGEKLKDIILPSPPPDKATREQLKKDIEYAFQK